MESKQMLFKDWQPEMGFPEVKPEDWSDDEWARAASVWAKLEYRKARDLRVNEYYSTPHLWVEVLQGVTEVGAAVAGEVKAAWDAFRKGYGSAYEDAKRESEENNNRDANSSRESEPDKPRRSPYDVLDVDENAPWSEIKSAYREAMKKLHPDRVSQTGIDPKTATVRAQEVNAAYVELEYLRSAS
jgi:hypothetical protein